MMELILVVVAIAIVVALACIAGVMLLKVRRLNKTRAAMREQAELVVREQRSQINTSIRILAKAVQAHELTLTEASIRISVLLDNLGVTNEVRGEFSAFYQLRKATEHIPFLEAWKQLSRQEQNAFELERLRHEETYGDFVLDAAKRINGREF